jgi:hypothetical protein
MYRPFRPTAISGHTRLTSGHKMAETYHAIISSISHNSTSIASILKKKTVCKLHRKEKGKKEEDSAYTENIGYLGVRSCWPMPLAPSHRLFNKYCYNRLQDEVGYAIELDLGRTGY